MPREPYLNSYGHITMDTPLEVSGAISSNGVVVPTRIYVSHTFSLAADMVDRYIFIAPTAMTLVSASAVFVGNEDAGTVGVMLRRCQGTEAPASGDALLDAGVDGTATDATVQAGTLLTTAVIDFAAGDRLGVDFTGDTPGELVGLTITCAFELNP